MDLLHAVVLIGIFILFAVSTVTDIILFIRLKDEKIVARENNVEIASMKDRITKLEDAKSPK